eukprot:SAG11_NODE_8907_length_964_cov_1.041618_1_plen_172_part_00
MKDQSGEVTISPSFPVKRGVVQGDICSPYGYICALALLFMRHDPEGTAGCGITLRGGQNLCQLTYADDSALLCSTAAEASQRVSNIRLGFRRDGDKEVSQPKTEAMKIRRRLGKSVSTEEEYVVELSLQCEFCGKGFDSEHGLHRHQTRTCAADGLPWWTADGLPWCSSGA